MLATMATRRPRHRKHDRVTLAPHKSVIPAYGGKPFVGRDTVLTVSHLTGTGSKRNPWHVVVTDGTHFWHLEPDDVVRVENDAGTSHSTVKRRNSQRDLDEWLDRHGYGYRHERARKQETPRPYAMSSRMAHATRAEHLFTYRNKHGSWSDVWATDVEHAKQQIRARKDAPGSFFTISRVTNVDPRERASHHARVIH